MGRHGAAARTPEGSTTEYKEGLLPWLLCAPLTVCATLQPVHASAWVSCSRTLAGLQGQLGPDSVVQLAASGQLHWDLGPPCRGPVHPPPLQGGRSPRHPDHKPTVVAAWPQSLGCRQSASRASRQAGLQGRCEAAPRLWLAWGAWPARRARLADCRALGGGRGGVTRMRPMLGASHPTCVAHTSAEWHLQSVWCADCFKYAPGLGGIASFGQVVPHKC
jgi:hypothetical protein